MELQIIFVVSCLFTCFKAEDSKILSQSRYSNTYPKATIDNSVKLGESVTIGDEAKIDENTEIGNYSEIGTTTEIGKRNVIENDVTIDRNVIIGNDNSIESECFIFENAKIGSNVKIQRKSKVGRESIISSFTSIGEHTKILSYCNIAENCLIGNNVEIGYLATIGSGNTIGDGSNIPYNSSTGENVTIGERVKVIGHVNISSSTEIGDDSILSRYSLVGGKIGSKVFICEHLIIENATINDSAVILNYVTIPSGETIKEKEVVIRSPSSYQIYIDIIAVKHYVLNISPNQGAIANYGATSGTISPQFNKLLRDLLNELLNDSQKSCDGETKLDLEKLNIIRCLYLNHVHRMDISLDYYQKLLDNETLPSTVVDTLRNEYHFDKNAQINVLEEDVKKLFIQALAIEQDIKREDRIGNDTICSMIKQIRDGEREVSCYRASYQGNSVQSSTWLHSQPWF